MGHDRKVSCVLCGRCEETKITGALSTKDQITAHQNCLLFSSGIYCRDSPQFDDLFGFSTEDVMDEVKRGSKLVCNKCKKKGATAGCEVKRCKKSYHYPCAVQEGAQTIEDADKGKYGLYCFTHYQKIQINNEATNGHDSSSTNLQTSKKPSKTVSSKNTEGNISLDSLSNSVLMLYCNKHAPSSHKKNGHESGPSVCSSDSNSASSVTRSSLKRQLSFSDKEEEVPSKRKPEGWRRIISDESSNSAEKEQPNTELAMFAPLESDLDESANSVPEHQLTSKNAENERPTGSSSGDQLMDESRDGNKDEDETIIHSDAESESLLLPVEVCIESRSTTCTSLSNQMRSPAHPSGILVQAAEGSSSEQNPGQQTAAPSALLTSSPVPPPPAGYSKPIITCSSLCTSRAVSPAPPETTCVSLLSSPSSPTAAPSDPEPSIDSTSFWRGCNKAGCTKAIFMDFIDKMNDISRRIQSDQASQEEYDLALKVMAASGKLTELVAKQQKDLEKKQMELQKAAAAMKMVVSALRR